MGDEVVQEVALLVEHLLIALFPAALALATQVVVGAAEQGVEPALALGVAVGGRVVDPIELAVAARGIQSSAFSNLAIMGAALVLALARRAVPVLGLFKRDDLSAVLDSRAVIDSSPGADAGELVVLIYKVVEALLLSAHLLGTDAERAEVGFHIMIIAVVIAVLLLCKEVVAWAANGVVGLGNAFVVATLLLSAGLLVGIVSAHSELLGARGTPVLAELVELVVQVKF